MNGSTTPTLRLFAVQLPTANLMQPIRLSSLKFSPPSTRRLDEGEKKDGYLALPSLKVYVLVEQDTDLVVVYRRTPDGFARETYEGRESTIPLPEINAELPLAAIYERVEFGSEPAESEEE